MSNGRYGSADYFDKVMTKFIGTNRADACKTAINLFCYDNNLFVLGALCVMNSCVSPLINNLADLALNRTGTVECTK